MESQVWPIMIVYSHPGLKDLKETMPGSHLVVLKQTLLLMKFCMNQTSASGVFKRFTLRLLTPPMETPDPPNDTPGALKQVVLTPHDITWSLRVICVLIFVLTALMIELSWCFFSSWVFQPISHSSEVENIRIRNWWYRWFQNFTGKVIHCYSRPGWKIPV